MPRTRSRIPALTGLIFVLQAWLFTALTWVLAPVIRRGELLEVGDVLLGCGVLGLAGALLGLAGLRHPAGKAAAALGALLLALLLATG
jgi:hypothetical protein